MERKYNNNRYRKPEPRREKKEGEKKMEKKCQYCSGEMTCRGSKDSVGTIYWKCRKCGRTVNFRKPPPKEVIPLTYVDKVRGIHG